MSTAIQFKHTPEQARAAWTAALRSGEYEQGKGKLCKEGKYCCLGIACELLLRLEGPLIEKVVVEGVNEYGGFENSPPWTVKEWLGLDTCLGGYRTESGWSDLAERNDAGTRFSEIADIIDAKPEGLVRA